jgi:hypothetical protein
MRSVSGYLLVVLLWLGGGCLWAWPLMAETSPISDDNLAFKLLQKQAAEYETALSQRITDNLSRYIPEDRFHLSVRIFWNPHQIQKLQASGQLSPKAGKLPGFPVFVKEAERGIDYYLGAGSVMKLRVEVLIDETLPSSYTDFIYQLVPVQARFVAERGDSVRVQAIPFPKSRKRPLPLDVDVSLTADEASTALVKSIEEGKKELDDLKPVIVNPVLERYVRDYEKQTIEKLTTLVAEYVDRKKFLLSVKFFWNPEEINKLKQLVQQADSVGKVKLPGFTIYLEERDTLYETMASSTSLLRMEISLMLDESVSTDVEPFLNKLIPMSVKIIPARGDRLVIFRGYFPRSGDEIAMLGRKKSDTAVQTDMELAAEIDNAFYRREYRQGLVLVDLLLSKKTDPYERIPLLKKKGTLHLLLQEKDLARAAWEQVRKINPEARETIAFLEYLR